MNISIKKTLKQLILLLVLLCSLTGKVWATLQTPTINFSIASHTYGSGSFTLTATSNSSGALSFTSGDATIATCTGTNGATCNLIGVGSVTITVHQASAAGFQSTTKTAQLTIVAQPPTLGSFSISPHTYGDAPFTLIAPTSNSAGAISFSSSNTNVASISGSTVTILGAGSSVITASQAADGNYSTGTKVATLTVYQLAPTFGIFNDLTVNYGDVPVTITAPSSNSSGSFTFSTSDPTIATVSGNILTFVGAGNATLTATQAASGNYSSEAITANIVVNGIAPSIGNMLDITQNFGSAPYTITDPTSTSPGSFSYTTSDANVATVVGNTITIVGDGTCIITCDQAAVGNYTSGSVQFNFTVTDDQIWTGAISTDWYNPGNWLANVVPQNYTGNAVIPSAPVNQPWLTNDVEIHNIFIDGGSVTINGMNFSILDSVTGNGIIKGSPTSSLYVLSAYDNSIRLGTTGTDSMLNNFTVDGGGSVTLANGVGVNGILNVVSGTLNTGNHLTLKSSSISNTAAVDAVGGTINGTTTVERYIPQGHRAFRDLAAPVANAGSFFANWQENGGNNPGCGVYITGIKSATPGIDVTTGLDKTTLGNHSLFTYNNSTWDSVKNTRATNIDPFMGYRISVRGDRNIANFGYATDPTNQTYNTTIRTTGNLIYGDVNYSTAGVTNAIYSSTATKLASGNGAYSLLANPYAAPLDWESIYANAGTQNIGSSYWYFDPTFFNNGYATYVTYNSVSHISSNPSGSKVNRYIQSGQAFFIINANNAAPTLAINEGNKVANSTHNAIFKSVKPNYISVSLCKNVNGTNTSVDGTVAVFNNWFTYEIGDKDSKKLLNIGENVFITAANTDLSIAGLPIPTVDDNIVIQLSQLKVNSTYQLKLDNTEFSVEGLIAYLHDAITHKDVLASDGITFVAEGNTLGNRFSIVFKSNKNGILVNSISKNVSVYPNPVTGKSFALKMNNMEGGNYIVRLFNVKGQEVMRKTLNHTTESTQNIATQTLPVGVYTVSVEGATSTCTTEIIIQ